MNLITKERISFTFLLFFSCFSYSSQNLKCPYSSLDGDPGRNHIIDQISSSLLDSFYDDPPKFKKYLDLVGMLSNKECKLADGRYVYNFIYHGVNKAFRKVDNDHLIQYQIQTAREQAPKNPNLLLLEAQFWNYYAWKARSYGYAHTVSEENWKLFRERLSKSERILIESKDIASTSALWYELLIQSLFYLDRPNEVIGKYYAEGLSSNKNYLPLYILIRNQLLPRWGGSWEQVDEFINWSVEKTKDIEGSGMYARLYYGIYDDLLKGQEFFKDTLADWGKLKIGFKDLIQTYPDSLFHKNVLALLSCEARDKDEYHRVRSIIEKPSSLTADELRVLSVCDKIMRYPK